MFNLLLAAILLHPVHETQSEVEWNSKTQRLEVALRLDVLDEQWLSKRLARKNAATAASGDQKQKPLELPAWAQDYLRRRFRVTRLAKQAEQDSATYHWVGRQPEGSHVWWFFEIEPRRRKRPDWIEITLLQEHPQAYSHRVLVLGIDPKPSLTLTHEKSRKPLPAESEEPLKDSEPGGLEEAGDAG